MKKIIRQLLSCLLVVGAPACFDDAPQGSVSFLSPEDGSTSSADVHVKLKVVNVDLAPARSHLFLLVDEPCLTAGQKVTVSTSRIDLGSTTELSLSLLPGAHDLCAEVVDENGEATEAMARVHFTVRAHPEAGVEILSPFDGAAEASTFNVKLAASDIELVPRGGALVEGQGHLYVVVDGDCPIHGRFVGTGDSVYDLIYAETELELSLPSGYHTICAGLADNGDQVLPQVSRKIQVYVAY